MKKLTCTDCGWTAFDFEAAFHTKICPVCESHALQTSVDDLYDDDDEDDDLFDDEK